MSNVIRTRKTNAKQIHNVALAKFFGPHGRSGKVKKQLVTIWTSQDLFLHFRGVEHVGKNCRTVPLHFSFDGIGTELIVKVGRMQRCPFFRNVILNPMTLVE